MTPATPTDAPYAAFNAPVALQACRVENSMNVPNSRYAGVPLVAGVEVRFVNRSSTTATDVLIRMRVSGSTQIVDAHGKFSPGVPINAIFYNFAGRDFFRPEPDACEVVEVRYDDGKAWDAPSTAAPHLR